MSCTGCPTAIPSSPCRNLRLTDLHENLHYMSSLRKMYELSNTKTHKSKFDFSSYSWSYFSQASAVCVRLFFFAFFFCRVLEGFFENYKSKLKALLTFSANQDFVHVLTESKPLHFSILLPLILKTTTQLPCRTAFIVFCNDV